MIDLITIGETMLRLTPPNNLRLSQATTLQTHFGGSEGNIAVAMARLGKAVTWVSRLPNHALGQRVANEYHQHGVDVSHIIWAEDTRLGVYYLEEGIAPRQSQILYDRANSAMSQMTSDDIPRELFKLDAARCFHVSGITAGLSQSTATLTVEMTKLAKAAGMKISFDWNYRAKLWDMERCYQVCHPIAEMADVMFLPLRDAKTLFQLDGGAENVMLALVQKYPHTTIVLTLGEDGSATYEDGEYIQQAAFPTNGTYRVGRGDAFVAGFLCQYLDDAPLDTALQWGNALASLKSTISGDVALVTRADVEAVIAGSASIQR